MPTSTLVWLIVAAYAAHLAEEYIGGFPEWFAVIAGRPLPAAVFVAINAVALVVMTAAAYLATRAARFRWIAIALATIVLVNGSAHLLATIATRSYSPGVITGVLLYLPLGSLVMADARRAAVPSSDFTGGIAAGLIAHAVVTSTAVALT